MSAGMHVARRHAAAPLPRLLQTGIHVEFRQGFMPGMQLSLLMTPAHLATVRSVSLDIVVPWTASRCVVRAAQQQSPSVPPPLLSAVCCGCLICTAALKAPDTGQQYSYSGESPGFRGHGRQVGAAAARLLSNCTTREFTGSATCDPSLLHQTSHSAATGIHAQHRQDRQSAARAGWSGSTDCRDTPAPSLAAHAVRSAPSAGTACGALHAVHSTPAPPTGGACSARQRLAPSPCPRFAMLSRSKKNAGPAGCMRPDALAARLMCGMPSARTDQVEAGRRPLTRCGLDSQSQNASLSACAGATSEARGVKSCAMACMR